MTGKLFKDRFSAQWQVNCSRTGSLLNDRIQHLGQLKLAVQVRKANRQNSWVLRRSSSETKPNKLKQNKMRRLSVLRLRCCAQGTWLCFGVGAGVYDTTTRMTAWLSWAQHGVESSETARTVWWRPAGPICSLLCTWIRPARWPRGAYWPPASRWISSRSTPDNCHTRKYRSMHLYWLSSWILTHFCFRAFSLLEYRPASPS